MDTETRGRLDRLSQGQRAVERHAKEVADDMFEHLMELTVLLLELSESHEASRGIRHMQVLRTLKARVALACETSLTASREAGRSG